MASWAGRGRGRPLLRWRIAGLLALLGSTFGCGAAPVSPTCAQCTACPDTTWRCPIGTGWTWVRDVEVELAPDSAELDARAIAILTGLLARMSATSGPVNRVAVWSSGSGTDAALAEARARAVSDWLTAAGAPSEMISLEAGEVAPPRERPHANTVVLWLELPDR